LKLNRAHATALKYHCRLAGETVNPRFMALLPEGVSRIITVNSGYE